MLRPILYSSLLLSLALAGCIGATPEASPDASNEEKGAEHLDWEQAIENTTYLVRIEADADFTIYKYVPERPPGIFWSVFTLVGHVPNSHASMGRAPMISIQDHDIDNPTPGYTPESNPESERTYGPGKYHVVFDSKGTETLFSVKSDSASLEVLAIDPTMANKRWRYDDDWEYHTQVYVMSRQLLHASTQIPLHNNYTVTFMEVIGDPWDLDLDPVCGIQTEGYLQPGEWWWIVSDEPIDLEAKTTAFVAGASLYFYTLDLPLDVPETGCWIHQDWE